MILIKMLTMTKNNDSVGDKKSCQGSDLDDNDDHEYNNNNSGDSKVNGADN